MIRTPLGPWINKNDISFIFVSSEQVIKEGVKRISFNLADYDTLYNIKLKLISNPDESLTVSSFYGTEEEAQKVLDKIMFSKND